MPNLWLLSIIGVTISTCSDEYTYVHVFGVQIQPIGQKKDAIGHSPGRCTQQSHLCIFLSFLQLLRIIIKRIKVVFGRWAYFSCILGSFDVTPIITDVKGYDARNYLQFTYLYETGSWKTSSYDCQNSQILVDLVYTHVYGCWDSGLHHDGVCAGKHTCLSDLLIL